MTSDELHQWMLSTLGPMAGENAWEQFLQLPEPMREQMLAASSSELPSPEQMRGLMQAFAQAGFSAPAMGSDQNASSDGSGTDEDSPSKKAQEATLQTDPETGNPIGFQVPSEKAPNGSSDARDGAAAAGDAAAGPSGNGAKARKAQGPAKAPAINADLARQIALISLPSDSQSVISGEQNDQVRTAFSNASLWLDSATSFEPAKGQPTTMTRADWVNSTIGRWSELVAPISKATAQALGSVFASRLGGDDNGTLSTQIFAGPIRISLPENMRDPKSMMETLGSASFSMQLGQSAAKLATEVLGSFDQGLLLSDNTAGAIISQNAESFAKGLEVPKDEVLEFLALRELATARLYHHVPWLPTQVQTLVEKYAQYIDIDLDAIEEQLRDASELSPEGLSGAVNLSNVAMKESPEQEQAKKSLERLMALIEGWVDAVVWRAGQASLPHIGQLREMMRRRRAAGGPAEQTFRELMGLDLRPVEARQACAAWERIMDSQGSDASDALWRHPDTLPTLPSHESDDAGSTKASSGDNGPAPDAGTTSASEHDWDAGLDELLREEATHGNDSNDPDGNDSGNSGKDSGTDRPNGSGKPDGSGTPDGSDKPSDPRR